MAATAAHTIKVYVNTSLGTPVTGYTEIANVSDVSQKRMVTLLDVTDFKDTSGEHTRIPGLGDAEIPLSGFWDSSDTNGQVVIRTAAFAKTAIYLAILPDGTNGKAAKYWVENYEEKGQPDGTILFSCGCKKDGAYTAVGSG